MVKTVEEIYQKKTPKEHILLRPDTYIGSVEKDIQRMYVYDSSKNMILPRTISYVPGLYKIFDEILVNAADNKQRDKRMNKIKVNICKDSISVYNNGCGIPIEIHKKENVYVPELIFGNLLTSSNYDDKEKKVTGGRNGYGAKLCNIFSKKFIVETCYKNKYYKQIFTDNMSVINEPYIEKKHHDDFTRITFEPDFKRFGMEYLDEDTEALLKKRVYDMCATVKNCKVYLNDNKLEISNFKEYVQMYFNSGEENNRLIIHKVINDRWELAVAVSDEQFSQVSFVNSISTSKGGTHINHVLDQLTQPLIDAICKKEKGLSIKPLTVKNSLFIFVNTLIENPAFDSQTKENLTLKVSSFGSKCTPMDDFIKKLTKHTDIIDKITVMSKAKQNLLLKKTDGTKSKKLTGIPKLDDANHAGTKNSSECTLILTEGDSAKTLAVAGLSVVGRDKYGVFPLRGKLLNVREASYKQISENEEVNSLKKILGLQHNKVYDRVESLRYGHVMIMTDQDFDGSHIKGLIINFFDHFYPSLLKVPGFLKEFVTPIVKCTKGKVRKDFFTIPEYETFKTENAETINSWTIKYYKGLGTSTPEESKEYFSNLNLHVKNFMAIKDEDKECIDLAFNKKKAANRKVWLNSYQSGTFLDQNLRNISIKDFVNKELILFSLADNIRSIPSIVDGLKPGQRKVLFSCFKRKLTSQIKVSQLIGYVSEHAAYHHGEMSLSNTIINLAYDFVGSNNINLLMPAGTFGSRLKGGDDHASSRYISTYLNPLTRLIFHVHDDPVLNYLNDDNLSIEPEYYVPILPMVLVNGAEGIGTGWSTSIPCYNPLDIIANIKKLMNNESMDEITPFYRNFTGDFIPNGPNKFICSGRADEINNGKEINVVELPVKVWNSTYKKYLDESISKNTLTNYCDYSTHRAVDIVIKPTNSFDYKYLNTSVSTTNMLCFDPNGKIKKYEDPREIIREFYDVRIKYYQKRKEHRLNQLNLDLIKIKNKVRFIRMVVSNQLVVMKRKKDEIFKDLETHDFVKYDGGYTYLLEMAIYSLTKERIEKLEQEYDDRKNEYEVLNKKTIKSLYMNDLDAFEKDYLIVVKKEKEDIQKEIYTKDKKQFKKPKNITGKIDLVSISKALRSDKSLNKLSSKVKDSKVKDNKSKSKLTEIKKLDTKKVKKSASVTSLISKVGHLDISEESDNSFIVSDDSSGTGPWSKYKNQ